MINQFIYDGIRSYDDMGLIITETPPFVFPERDFTFEDLPARSGSLIYDNDRWKNVQVEYKVMLTDDRLSLDAAAAQLAVWLANKAEYKALTDSYDPDYFRMAVPTGALSIAQKARRLGITTIKFSAKPYRYSYEGLQPVTFASSGLVYNPEKFPSRPLIRVEAAAEATIAIVINGKTYLVKNDGTDLYRLIDTDSMTVYVTGGNKMSDYMSTEFPELKPGWNSVSVGAGQVTASITITPRWRRI